MEARHRLLREPTTPLKLFDPCHSLEWHAAMLEHVAIFGFGPCGHLRTVTHASQWVIEELNAKIPFKARMMRAKQSQPVLLYLTMQAHVPA